MRRITFSLLALVVFGVPAQAQQPETLPLGKPVTFSIAPKGTRHFRLELRRDDYAEVSAVTGPDLALSVTITGPGKEVIVEEWNASDSIPFVATEEGVYTLAFTAEPAGEDVPNAPAQRVTVTYTNKFKRGRGTFSASRKINGYDVRIFNERGDDGYTYILVGKSAKLKAIMKRPMMPYMGFTFKDRAEKDEAMSEKRSAALFASTPDKTGDGLPDVAVEYYSGGAHCCFDVTFFELGKQVKQLGPFATEHDRLTAVKRKPGGGLLFEAADPTFAYWAISFAGSPMPVVKYEFEGGRLRPNFELMKKPAPSLGVLKQRALAARKMINLNAYVDPESNFNDFEEAFWGEMLELIYSGHEDLAWQYFDLVWPAEKTGKDKFLRDFKETLSKGPWGESHKVSKVP